MEHDEQRSWRLRSAASVALPTLARRLTGYVRDLLQAYFLGPGRWQGKAERIPPLNQALGNPTLFGGTPPESATLRRNDEGTELRTRRMLVEREAG